MNNYIGMKAKAKDLPQNLHMTVRFLGDGSSTSLVAVKNALQRFRGIAFPATVTGKAIFNPSDLNDPNIDPDSVVKPSYVYLLKGEWLEHFCSQMHETLNRVNIQECSFFEWSPHVTVSQDVWEANDPEEFLLGMPYVKWNGKAHGI